MVILRIADCQLPISKISNRQLAIGNELNWQFAFLTLFPRAPYSGRSVV
jgi:hypothetical protein